MKRPKILIIYCHGEQDKNYTPPNILCFEDEHKPMTVDPFDLKRLKKVFMDKTGVPLFIINACYSGKIGQGIARTNNEFRGP